MEKMTDKKSNCPPSPRPKCPGGCMPGQCLNASCKFQLHEPTVLGHPNIEHEAQLRKECIKNAKMEQDKIKSCDFLDESKRQMGMEFLALSCKDQTYCNNQIDKCGQISREDYQCVKPKTPDVPLKPMRGPVRPSCMLDPPPFTPPTDDYNDLSRFLRISTMPGYSANDEVSEYHDNHNMSVWNNRKEIDPQVFKMKRDWLSVWGEFNVKEQNWRKAWTEKFGV